MTPARKPTPSEQVCEQVNNTDSVEELRCFFSKLHLREVPFDLDPKAWNSSRPKDLMVLEAVVVRLRELIESGKLEPESENGEPEEEEEDDE